MNTINSETKTAWQELANEASLTRPSVGKTVKITGGRKHKNKSGIVVWHGLDQYSVAFVYGDNATHHLLNMQGRYGFRIGVQTQSGEKFFCNAEYAEVSPAA